MVHDTVEGWYVDPFGVHAARWFSDGTPTALVRDQGGIESRDDPQVRRSRAIFKRYRRRRHPMVMTSSVPMAGTPMTKSSIRTQQLEASGKGSARVAGATSWELGVPTIPNHASRPALG
jgi:hypothetical protein